MLPKALSLHLADFPGPPRAGGQGPCALSRRIGRVPRQGLLQSGHPPASRCVRIRPHPAEIPLIGRFRPWRGRFRPSGGISISGPASRCGDMDVSAPPRGGLGLAPAPGPGPEPYPRQLFGERRRQDRRPRARPRHGTAIRPHHDGFTYRLRCITRSVSQLFHALAGRDHRAFPRYINCVL